LGVDGFFFKSKSKCSWYQSTNNILLACARNDSSYHLDNVQLVHEGGDLEKFDFVVINEQQQ
jgi:hypothetical protein